MIGFILLILLPFRARSLLLMAICRLAIWLIHMFLFFFFLHYYLLFHCCWRKAQIKPMDSLHFIVQQNLKRKQKNMNFVVINFRIDLRKWKEETRLRDSSFSAVQCRAKDFYFWIWTDPLSLVG